MLVLALDTTTRRGSLALARDGVLLEVSAGDEELTHAARLPGDLLRCLERHGLGVPDVDLFAVAAGPGSFTGLRIGIATIQGLAFAGRRPVVAVSALDALAHAAAGQMPSGSGLIGAWMDAHRREVYACLYRKAERPSGTPVVPGPAGVASAADLGDLQVVSAAEVRPPEAVVESWVPKLDGHVVMLGDGATTYRELLLERMGQQVTIMEHPLIAAVVAEIATSRAGLGQTIQPHAIRPFYVRRPDAELERDRRARASRTGSEPGGVS